MTMRFPTPAVVEGRYAQAVIARPSDARRENSTVSLSRNGWAVIVAGFPRKVVPSVARKVRSVGGDSVNKGAPPLAGGSWFEQAARREARRREVATRWDMTISPFRI